MAGEQGSKKADPQITCLRAGTHRQAQIFCLTPRRQGAKLKIGDGDWLIAHGS